jgi:cellulose synthase/poly-beta-1,6-N-acetylglucosamine synthase-like glycosyltransferase
MAEIAYALAWLLLLVLTTQVAWLTLQVCAAKPSMLSAAIAPSTRACCVILIPAHNEAGGIKHALQSARSQLAPGDRILVVADNCSDGTATVARQYGVDVIEREDGAHRGKGFALAFGVDSLRRDPPDIVVFLDADCELAAGALDWLAYSCQCNDRPVQAAYLMDASTSSAPMKRLAEFAWTVKNWIRPLGARRLGLGCHLQGSGMALPWRLAATAPLATSHLVEDLKLGLDLALAGAMPVFCPEAVVTSCFPDNPAGASAQRTRWEHGHLSLIASYVPRLIVSAVRKRNVSLLMLAIDLSVPPLSLLLLTTACSALCGGAMFLVTGRSMPGLGFSMACCALLIALIVAQKKAGRNSIGLRHAFLYIGSKIPLYLRFLIKRQTEWIRSDRDQR